MFSLFKKSKGDDGPPPWANFFTTKEYHLFVQKVAAYFEQHNLGFTIDDGVALLDQPHHGYDNFGLVNLAQMCKQEDAKNWDQTILGFFKSMQRSQEFEDEFNNKITDFEFVRPFIGVRIYNIQYIQAIDQENFIYRQLSGEMIAMLVFDLPDSVINIKPDQTEPWHKSIEELYAVGYANIRENYPIEIMKEDFGETALTLAAGDHFFAPNIILALDTDYPHLVGSNGTLIGIPHRHAVLIYPIEDLGVLQAVNTLIPVIKGMNLEGPGSISHELYWYKNGQFHNLPYELSEKKLTFTPPEDFVNMLNTLNAAQ